MSEYSTKGKLIPSKLEINMHDEMQVAIHNQLLELQFLGIKLGIAEDDKLFGRIPIHPKQ